MPSKASPPVMYVNIGWMKNYAGPDPNDRTRGNFGYLVANRDRHGHECFNFLKKNGRYYGYKPGSKGVGITNLGARRNEPCVHGVFVVWMARNPDTGKTVVVGWYDNATVYKQPEVSDRKHGHRLDGEYTAFSVSAAEKDGHLIDHNHRDIVIPSRNERDGGFGQSPVWYGFSNRYNAGMVRKLRNRLNQPTKKPVHKKPGGRGGLPRNNDTEKRLLVEKRAVDFVTAFYEKKYADSGVKVVSVELQAKGWDLEVFVSMQRGARKRLHLVEVKGRSNNELVAELTPNEYTKMNSPGIKEDYVVFIVVDCLAKKQTGYEYRYKHDSKEWETEDGDILRCTPIVGARLTSTR